MNRFIIGCFLSIPSAVLAQSQHDMHHHESTSENPPAQTSMIMQGAFGRYPMTLDGSGTAWNPQSSPMFMKMLPKSGRYDMGLMGIATLNYTKQGGPRGASQFYTTSMAMLMAQRDTGGGTLALRTMVSLDPINGEKGYPLLFQTGETAFGKPLVDRQHPHDALAELAVSFSKPLNDSTDGFVYIAPIGEPALGDTMYLHRPSTGDNVEAPISHHWFDSTHIAYGVLTGGLIFSKNLKLEASAFNGREPNENRWDIDPIKINSYSARVEYNPTPELSLSAAYGFLKEPEVTDPGEDVHRLTAALQYSRDFDRDHWFAAGVFFGRNVKDTNSTSALALEATYNFGDTQLFSRAERVDKDELLGVPAGIYTINKLALGASRSLMKKDGYDWALAGNVDFYSYPKSLEPFYGKNPVSFGIFFRVRPERMIHHMGGM